jgi:hypothetical protein
MAGSKKKITMNRNSKTGKLVTAAYAKAHPATTETERRPAPKPKKK